MTNDIKYIYALDEQGQTVSINDIPNEDKSLHTYHCISCNAAMIPRMGKVRKWHFAHKGTEEHCNPETYLHKLAKRLVKEKFDDSNSFEISYYQDVKCSLLQTCSLAQKSDCHYKMLKTYDLKKYYDTCNVEQPIDNYIADLLLTNSKQPSIKPILIEIQVSHECEIEKKKSGLHIIELRIKDENGITDLLKTDLKENSYADRDIDNIGFAKFYGFTRKCKEPEPLEVKRINRFYLYYTGNSYVESISCKYQPENKIKTRTLFEVSIGETKLSTYKMGYLLAIQNGVITRACCFCKYYRSGFDVGKGDNSTFCCLYKNYGTPKNPIETHAQECEYYRDNEEDIDFIEKHMPKYIIAK
ncbi:MAG: hypothetical protein IKW77_08550 [Salinivirgaceae bacterium]|nr:hypothetical protein [Salinivirgaceae bacterium]